MNTIISFENSRRKNLSLSKDQICHNISMKSSALGRIQKDLALNIVLTNTMLVLKLKKWDIWTKSHAFDVPNLYSKENEISDPVDINGHSTIHPVCDICAKEFKTEPALKAHKTKFHKTNKNNKNSKTRASYLGRTSGPDYNDSTQAGSDLIGQGTNNEIEDFIETAVRNYSRNQDLASPYNSYQEQDQQRLDDIIMKQGIDILANEWDRGTKSRAFDVLNQRQ